MKRTSKQIESNENLKKSIREFLKGIHNKTDLLMLYGMASAAFNDKESQKGGAE